MLELHNHVPIMMGIPPHIVHMHKITAIEGYCNDNKAAVMNFKSELRDAVLQAIDDKAEESGGINAYILAPES
jgi:hypothetical protein